MVPAGERSRLQQRSVSVRQLAGLLHSVRGPALQTTAQQHQYYQGQHKDTFIMSPWFDHHAEHLFPLSGVQTAQGALLGPPPLLLLRLIQTLCFLQSFISGCDIPQQDGVQIRAHSKANVR